MNFQRYNKLIVAVIGLVVSHFGLKLDEGNQLLLADAIVSALVYLAPNK